MRRVRTFRSYRSSMLAWNSLLIIVTYLELMGQELRGAFMNTCTMAKRQLWSPASIIYSGGTLGVSGGDAQLMMDVHIFGSKQVTG